jgi:hypothetical protein
VPITPVPIDPPSVPPTLRSPKVGENAGGS